MRRPHDRTRASGYIVSAVESETREGITRRPRGRNASELPLTENQAATLAAMTVGEPIGPTAIAGALKCPKSRVSSSLYALADRGLVERLGGRRGWMRCVNVETEPESGSPPT